MQVQQNRVARRGRELGEQLLAVFGFADYLQQGVLLKEHAQAEPINGILKNELLFVLPDDLAQAHLPVE